MTENGKKFCIVCNDILIDPVTLVCEHTFCKECVESLLKFRYDGSATIICPMQCKSETRLPADATASCLVGNLENYINVELSLSCTARKAACRWKVCKRRISRFCLTCEFTFCVRCWSEHLAQCSNTEPHVPVRYDYKTDDITAICVQHQTCANFVCLNCEYKFICVYCKHRTHKCHFVCSAGAKLADLSSCSFFDKPRIGIERRKLSLNEVEECEEKLKVELKKRKLQCLVDYLELLNEEESKLILDFQRQCSLFSTISDKHVRTENGRRHSAMRIEVSLTSCAMSAYSPNLGNLNIELAEMSCQNENAGICLRFQETEIYMENRDFKEDFDDCLSIRGELSSKESDLKLNTDTLPVCFSSSDESSATNTIIEDILNSCVKSKSSSKLGNELNQKTCDNEEDHADMRPNSHETGISSENRDFEEDVLDCTSIRRESSSKECNSVLNPDALPIFFPSNDESSVTNHISQTYSKLNPDARPVFYPGNNGALDSGVALYSAVLSRPRHARHIK